MRGDLLWLRFQIFRVIRPDIKRNIIPQVPFPVIGPREQRAVYQCFKICDAILNLVAGNLGAIKCGNPSPALWQGDRRLHLNGAGEMPGGVHRDLFPLHIHHIWRDVNAPFAFAHRRGELEFHIDRCRPCGHIDMKGVNLHGIARPSQSLATSADHEARHFGQCSTRTVLTWQPLRIQQNERLALFNGNCLAHLENGAVNIGRIHL